VWNNKVHRSVCMRLGVLQQFLKFLLRNQVDWDLIKRNKSKKTSNPPINPYNFHKSMCAVWSAGLRTSHKKSYLKRLRSLNQTTLWPRLDFHCDCLASSLRRPVAAGAPPPGRELVGVSANGNNRGEFVTNLFFRLFCS
jgi:hypothetical protein